MSQLNRIAVRCLPLRWLTGAIAQAVTGSLLVFAHNKGGRYPVMAGVERLVSKTELSTENESSDVYLLQRPLSSRDCLYM